MSLSSGCFQFITPAFDIHYFSRTVWGWPTTAWVGQSVGGGREGGGGGGARLWMGLQCLTSPYFLSFPLRSVCARAPCVCPSVCLCAWKRCDADFRPAVETGDAALRPRWSHSEAFRPRRGSYLKQRGFPSALSRFPEMGQSGEISQFRDVLTFCNDFLLCFIQWW